ncbi:MAG: hypothetical protein C4K49_10045, partial [Candidatus Thorarchaeota archaeon]
NIGRAVRVLYVTDVIASMTTLPILIGDVLYLFMFGLLLLAAALLRSRALPSTMYDIGVVLLVLSALAIHGLIYFLIVPNESQFQLQVIGMVLGVASAATILLSGAIWSRQPAPERTYNLAQMTVGFTLFGLSWFPTVMTMYFSSIIWSMSFILRSVGLCVLNIAVMAPFLIKVGMKQLRAYEFALMVSLLALIPAFITVVAERFMLGFYYAGRDTYYVTHVGTAILSAVMAFLVMAYNQQRRAMNRYPLIWLYLGWSVIQVFLVVSAALSPEQPFHESLIPYIIGSLLFLVMLPLAVRWTRSPPRPVTIHIRLRLIVLGMLAVFLIILLSTGIQDILVSIFPALDENPLDRSFMISVNLLVIFALVYLAMVLVENSRGRVSVDVLSVAILSVWIAQMILKGNYTDWTAGWWSAEMLLLLALLFGPAVLVFIYVKELVRAESAQRKATLFADLLVHDISNFHQAILVCLNLLEMEDLPNGLRERTLQDASSELMRADHLIRNVRRLGMVDSVTEESLVPVDVVQTAQEAFQTAARSAAADGFSFSMNRTIGECFVVANALLADVFLNLFHNSVEYASDDKSIEIAISPLAENGRDYWEIRVTDHSAGIEPRRKAKLFERYMDGAHGTGLGLWVVKALVDAFGGKVSVEDRIKGDYTKGIVFVITLAAAKRAISDSSSNL